MPEYVKLHEVRFFSEGLLDMNLVCGVNPLINGL